MKKKRNASKLSKKVLSTIFSLRGSNFESIVSKLKSEESLKKMITTQKKSVSNESNTLVFAQNSPLDWN